MVKSFLVIPLVLLLSAQKPVKKPDVHPDFQFGSYPWSRTAEGLMKEELARQIVVGYAQGWSIDKIAKTLKLAAPDVSKVSDKLEDERLVARREDAFDPSPVMAVVRERDWDRMKEPLSRHTQEFTKLLIDHWTEIETMVDSLQGAKGISKGRLMYETIVSGILLGGMMDAFYEDQTLMPSPRRRGKTDRYFAWLVESNPAAAGKLRRELRESAGYRVVTIGTELAEDKRNPDEMRGKDTVLEDADARKYRTFISVFTRDKLLPYFKSRRSEFLKLAPQLSSSGNIAFADFFAWYYNTMANGVADALAAQRRITPPEKLYTYAVKAPL
jgi:DNA-binding MarR family transcriptional regulator